MLSWSLLGSQAWGDIQLALQLSSPPRGGWWLVSGPGVTSGDPPKACPTGSASRLITVGTHLLRSCTPTPIQKADAEMRLGELIWDLIPRTRGIEVDGSVIKLALGTGDWCSTWLGPSEKT